MNGKILKAILSRLACLLVLVACATGCLKEDRTNCGITWTFKVLAYDNSGAEVTAGDVSDVILFVFNGDMRFVERIDTQTGQSITINAPGGEYIHVVGWGNLGGGLQNYTQPFVGEHKDNCFVSLLPDTRSTSYALSPNDLFRGEITVMAHEQSGEKILPIYRQTGSMGITVRGLDAITGYSGDDYSITVHETRSRIDFSGNLSGDKVAYRPAGTFITNSGQKEYHVLPFNMIPEDSGIHIEIYHETQLIVSVSADSADNPIIVRRGELTNVLIELDATLSVTVSLTEWGMEQVWKEF